MNMATIDCYGCFNLTFNYKNQTLTSKGQYQDKSSVFRMIPNFETQRKVTTENFVTRSAFTPIYNV